MRRLPPLIALLYFEAAARTRSFARAAKELHVTPAAVSHQVKALEEYLDVELFLRHNRTVSLTPVAVAALPLLQQGFEALSDAVEQMRRDGNSQWGITVCAEPLFATKWLVPRLHHFYERCPEVEVRIQASIGSIDSEAVSPPDAAGFLRSGIDLSIRLGHGIYPELYVQKLLDVQLKPYCSPELAQEITTSPDRLMDGPLLCDTSTSRATEKFGWLEWFASASMQEPASLKERRFGNALLALEAAIAGQGILLMEGRFVQPEIASGLLVAPTKHALDCPYSYFFTCPQRSLDRPVVRSFRDWVFEEMAGSRGEMRRCSGKVEANQRAEA
ncbi:Regulatory protein, LysR:LysR, substrate-binding protein [Cupriavidus phytorum]|uniref:Regulatory protein, LysR:LysR, substrate-binding protein n=2 Tax=Cupriavidus TaxID=106589 RepID=A0A375CIY0_9BURK|nr:MULTISPECIES: LysR substrate-binding domain-containing protein [Cupriavidus]MCO4887873.1 LysR substrate-binding domain-containing protein [Cupriavidus sp. WGtm5]PZX34248.1 LysR family transcriptional regulator [Cupriavidus alkaliphilus]SOY71851.1 Regulatory protein, LysR:LysR, substrate-binding protein [Cupriavidus taiwanensis]